MRCVKPAIDFSFPGIAGDVQRLRRLLGESLGLLGMTPPPTARILNLACGRADETGILLETLNGNEQGGHYLGLDLRAAEIAEATKRWRQACTPQGTIEFRVADAALPHHWPTSERFDFIFIRHQNYWDAPAVWDRIFYHAMKHLADTGVLIFTSYFEREHELALAALQTQRAHLLLNLPHVDSRALTDAPGKSVDKRLAILAAESFVSNRILEESLHLRVR